MGGEQRLIQVLVENLRERERDHLEDPSIDGRIRIK
jgi:hypothetical protein